MKKVKKTKKKLVDKWGKKKIFIYDIKPYNHECIIVINGQMKDVVKYLKKAKVISTFGMDLIKEIENNYDEKYSDIVKEGNGRLYFGDETGYILLVNHSNSWLKTISNVSHEANHLSHYILRNAGIELNQDTEEAYTYLQAQILKDILNEMY